MRRGNRNVSTARTGAPTSMPTANPEISSPASGIVTPRSVAIIGSNPASISSDVPCAKIASPSTMTATGMTLPRSWNDAYRTGTVGDGGDR